MQKKNASAEFRIDIGGIVISASTDDSRAMFKLGSGLSPFVTATKADVVLRIHYSDALPSFQFEEKIFASGGLWELFKSGDKYILCCKTDADGATDRMAVFSPDFYSGDIYIDSRKRERDFSYPLRFPLDEIMVVNLFSLGMGSLIHACGVKEDGGGIAFIGNSGAGKSTVANLFKKKKDTIILSDDRIIVRKKEKQFHIYGTPWHGNADICSPENAPLKKIFFLKHAPRNTIRKMTQPEAVSRLITCSFFAFWNKNGMRFALKLCAELAERIPCYELGFLQDESVLDFIRSNG